MESILPCKARGSEIEREGEADKASEMAEAGQIGQK